MRLERSILFTTALLMLTTSVIAQSPESTLKIEADPLITGMYTADPSAHVFQNKLYIYPSHDWESGETDASDGNKFAMKDYHVFSMDTIGGKVTDHGVALALEDIPWVKRQLWAPDAAEKDGKYYLYFPAKDHDDIFRIGVAVSDKPSGPFKPKKKPMKGTYSIDPAIFKDGDGSYYMYVGGIWGGQLQRWNNGEYSPKDNYPKANEPALKPRIARLSSNMLNIAEPLKEIDLLDEKGNPLTAGDTTKRFFEAAWMHKHNGTYYLSWSTGDTHNIAYGIGKSPYGPFVYQGIILEEVIGWTNHHSIVEFEGKWYLFFHDSSQSNGATHLRTVKMTQLFHKQDGRIQRMNAKATLDKGDKSN